MNALYRNTVFAALAFTFAALNGFSQARLVFNSPSSYMVIDNAAYVVIDNPNPNAITILGTSANIISENELDVIKWNIGATTGAYTIPWTTRTTLTNIPLTVNKNTAGVGAGYLILSTYETSTDMNTPWPSDVTNMYSNVVGGDGSLYVVDRFWRIDANSYATKPDVVLDFTYDDAANEIAVTNTIIEANLQAQRFNTVSGGWDGLLYGTGNPIPNTVTGANIVAADFYMSWTLTDLSAPLPVELIYFNAACEDDKILLTWSTATETDNDYFTVEKSLDGTYFTAIAEVNGAGNSNTVQNYSAYDYEPSQQLAYYRLKQTDYDGKYEYSDLVNIQCNQGAGVTFTVYPNPSLSASDVYVSFKGLEGQEEVLLVLRDVLGRVVYSQVIFADDNGSVLTAIDPYKRLAAGTYMVIGSVDDDFFSKKIIIY